MPGSVVKRDESGKLALDMGGMEVGFAVLDTIEPPRRATSRSLPDQQLVTTYTLDEERGGTQVTITMTGFEDLPEAARQDRVNLSNKAWETALENLKAHVDRQELPHPFAPVAPLFGFFREPQEKVAVERSIWINAPRERVWKAITDPEQLDKWFSPGTQWQGTGLKVGGKLFVLDPESKAEMYTQVIEIVDPPSQLVTRSLPEPEEVSYVTNWMLTEENSGTRLTILHTGYELAPMETRNMNMEQNAFGFGMMLGNIKAVIEGTPLPMPGGF
jgi:uncharacterized protein YndB with AHSA1/START domain